MKWVTDFRILFETAAVPLSATIRPSSSLLHPRLLFILSIFLGWSRLMFLFSFFSFFLGLFVFFFLFVCLNSI